MKTTIEDEEPSKFSRNLKTLSRGAVVFMQKPSPSLVGGDLRLVWGSPCDSAIGGQTDFLGWRGEWRLAERALAVSGSREVAFDGRWRNWLIGRMDGSSLG